jgi:hypothetical protein
LNIFRDLSAQLHLGKKSNFSTVLPLSLFVTFGTGLSTTALCGWIYGESICVSFALGIAGVSLLLPLFFDKKIDSQKIWFAGLLLALAGLTRVSWFLVFGSAITVFVLKKKKVFAPLITCILVTAAVQAILNVMRFNNPFEFGLRFSTGVLDARAAGPEHLFSIGHLLANVMTYFFSGLPPHIHQEDGRATLMFNAFTRFFHSDIYAEFPCALFLVMPSLFLGIPALMRIPRKSLKKVTLFASIFIPAGLLILFHTQVWRYQIEVWLFPLCLLVPALQSGPSQRKAVLHWISLLMCLGLTSLNTYFVVFTRLDQL